MTAVISMALGNIRYIHHKIIPNKLTVYISEHATNSLEVSPNSFANNALDGDAVKVTQTSID